MVNFNAFLIIMNIDSSSLQNLSQNSTAGLTELIFYTVGALAAFYFYRKLKKRD